MRPKNASSKTNYSSHPYAVMQGSVSPTSSPRSEARRGTKSLKSSLPIPQDDLQRPDRSHSSIHTAPVKDTPPHLVSKDPPAPTSFDLSKDIDVLVERVRALAMAENRPLTPGSHIDWAGEDDDSLPDLDDWGITTADSNTPIISPIIITGLKPLPELTPSSADDGTIGAHVGPSQPTENPENGKALISTDEAQDLNTFANHDLPALKGLAQSIHAPPTTRTDLEKESLAASTPPAVRVHPGKESPTASTPPVAHTDLDGESLAASIYAPRNIVSSTTASIPPVAHTEPDGESLAASIYAPRNIVSSTFTPNFPRHGQGHDRRTYTSNRNGRGRSHRPPKQHLRNHSSPVASTHHSSRSRPTLSKAAISRLTKVVVNTAPPSSKATPTTND